MTENRWQEEDQRRQLWINSSRGGIIRSTVPCNCSPGTILEEVRVIVGNASLGLIVAAPVVGQTLVNVVAAVVYRSGFG